jgi:hypothetical protein
MTTPSWVTLSPKGERAHLTGEKAELRGEGADLLEGEG